MPKLNELELRRDDFAGGVPITLADGQAWTFPEPVPLIVPDFSDDGLDCGSLSNRAEFGAEYDDLLDAYYECEGDDSRVEERFRAEVKLAARLLLRNYKLTGRDLSRLLQVRIKQPDNDAMWDALRRLFLGIVPKVTGTGDAPS